MVRCGSCASSGARAMVSIITSHQIAYGIALMTPDHPAVKAGLVKIRSRRTPGIHAIQNHTRPKIAPYVIHSMIFACSRAPIHCTAANTSTVARPAMVVITSLSTPVNSRSRRK